MPARQPVHVKKDVPGFIGNRLQHALWREAIALVEHGICDAETVDTVIKASFGRRLAVLGPLENADLVGTDLTLAIHRTVLPDIEHRPGPSPYLEELVAQRQARLQVGRGLPHMERRGAGGIASQGAAASEEGARERRLSGSRHASARRETRPNATGRFPCLTTIHHGRCIPASHAARSSAPSRRRRCCG